MGRDTALTHTIVSEGDSRGLGVGLTLFAGVFLLTGVALLLFLPDARIVGAIFALIGGGLMIPALKAVNTHRRMDPGELQVATPALLLSTTVPARFQRRVKRGSRDVRTLQARMVLREWVRYTVGTDTRTATQDVVDHPVPIRWEPDPLGIVGYLDVAIPAYPPAFEASNNKVRWLLIVEVALADGFTEDSEIPLPVVPATAAPMAG